MTRLNTCLLFAALLSACRPSNAQVFPGGHWQQYNDPTAAGLDRDKLDTVQAYFEAQGGACLLVVINGKVAVSWGAPNRRFRQASVRKSYMNAIFGRYEEKIDLNKNLGQLAITDRRPLTDREKTATVKDLMMTSSGIYLPSAYALNLDRLPERGSAAPGEQWFYNNWDFNVLRSIFLKEVGKDPFEVFYREIAQPLGMEDFRLQDTRLYDEPDKSNHPAYLFKMSARDMARFGWLYLQRGRWGDQQLLSPEWVRRSTHKYTDRLQPEYGHYGGYGLLWWTGKPIDGHRYYFASGAGGQRIIIFPDEDMVVVHLTDTYQRSNVSQPAINELLKQLLHARIAEPLTATKTRLLEEATLPTATAAWMSDERDRWIGNYQLPNVGEVRIYEEDGSLLAELGIGTFTLLPQQDDTVIIEDILINAVLREGNASQKGTGTFEFNDEHEISKLIFYN